jgi:UDP-3-O-[3-hydroxymyristoyl] glucosamine N-acyltransferase
MRKQATLQELASLTDSSFVGDGSHVITGVDTLDLAGPEDASFLANPLYRGAMLKSKAGVICVSTTTPLEEGKNFLLCENPSLTFQKLVEYFLLSESRISGFEGIHSTAVIHPSVKLGKNVRIGPYVVIDQGTTIGDDTQIGSHSSIGPGVCIGSSCILYPHVTIRERCTIGNRVIIQPGAVVGSCGFGFLTDAKGHHTKLEQLGTVVIEDDVEIGANTTIDRARFKTTRISQGSKIDNLVQLGHNVSIGPHNLIVSQTGIAGSTSTGRNVIVGGQTGIVGHIHLADGVMIAARGGVSKSITEPGKYAGSPVMPLSEYNKTKVLTRKIEDFLKRIEALEEKLK